MDDSILIPDMPVQDDIIIEPFCDEEANTGKFENSTSKKWMIEAPCGNIPIEQAVIVHRCEIMPCRPDSAKEEVFEIKYSQTINNDFMKVNKATPYILSVKQNDSWFSARVMRNLCSGETTWLNINSPSTVAIHGMASVIRSESGIDIACTEGTVEIITDLSDDMMFELCEDDIIIGGFYNKHETRCKVVKIEDDPLGWLETEWDEWD